MEKLNVCLVNDSFPPDIDGVANAVVSQCCGQLCPNNK